MFANQSHSSKFAVGVYGSRMTCRNCLDGKMCARATMPYAAKLFFHELFSMGCVVRMSTRPRVEIATMMPIPDS